MVTICSTIFVIGFLVLKPKQIKKWKGLTVVNKNLENIFLGNGGCIGLKLTKLAVQKYSKQGGI